MKPDQFLSFLDLCGPSQAQPQGQKMIPWDCQKLMLKHINMCFIFQNFSSNGQTGKKFDVFPSMAFKRTALQPLKVVKPFFDTLLVLEEVWQVSFKQSSQVSEITHISHLNSSHNKCNIYGFRAKILIENNNILNYKKGCNVFEIPLIYRKW